MWDRYIATMDGDTLLRAGEVAALIGIHPSTLERWVSRGYLVSRYRTPGGHRLFAARDVEAMMRRNDGSVYRERLAKVRARRGGGRGV